MEFLCLSIVCVVSGNTGRQLCKHEGAGRDKNPGFSAILTYDLENHIKSLISLILIISPYHASLFIHLFKDSVDVITLEYGAMFSPCGDRGIRIVPP
jgi:hypothetical protein